MRKRLLITIDLITPALVAKLDQRVEADRMTCLGELPSRSSILRDALIQYLTKPGAPVSSDPIGTTQQEKTHAH